MENELTFDKGYYRLLELKRGLYEVSGVYKRENQSIIILTK